MSYTKQDFQRDFVLEHLGLLSPDEVLNRYSPDDRLKDLSPDDRLKGLSADERLKGLSADDLDKLLEKLISAKNKKAGSTGLE